MHRGTCVELHTTTELRHNAVHGTFVAMCLRNSSTWNGCWLCKCDVDIVKAEVYKETYEKQHVTSLLVDLELELASVRTISQPYACAG